MTPAPRRRARRHLALAAVLLAAAALLMSVGAREPTRTEKPDVEFPVRMRAEEQKRMERRATLALPAPRGESAPAPAPAPEPALRDPFLVGLPVEEGEPVVVFEANALRHSRLGELFVACVLARDPDTFAEVERAIGVDPLKDIDRVAFVGGAMVVSGFFDRLKPSVLDAEGRPAAYGEAGRLWIPDPRGGTVPDPGRPAIALWKDQLLVVSDDPDALRRSIDQLEGRAPVPDAGIPDDMAYGEVYGAIPGEAARRLFGRDERGLGERLAAVASRIELHVDAQSDLAAVVRVRGDDAEGLSDLGKSIGAALAVARVQAQATDDTRFADLLASARVQDRGGALAIELAVPAERLESWFRDCGPARARR